MGYSEQFQILDCGEKISTPEINMTKKGLELYWKYKSEEYDMTRIGMIHEKNQAKYDEWLNAMVRYETKRTFHNENDIYCQCGACYPPSRPKLQLIEPEELNKLKSWEWIGSQHYTSAMDPMLFRYYDIKPFEPWVMINISPDWAGKKIQRQNICKLTKIFENYMKEGWYSEWKYVLEAGGNGDFLHLHALCKMGSDLKKLKSVRTHVGKSNFKNQLIKYARSEGLEGFIKKPGMQGITIQGENGEALLNDKLDYLVEEKKPAGHKNKTPKTLEKALGVIREGSLLNLLSRETS